MQAQKKHITPKSRNIHVVPAEADGSVGQSLDPQLALYAVVMERLLDDPKLEAAFFGLENE